MDHDGAIVLAFVTTILAAIFVITILWRCGVKCMACWYKCCEYDYTEDESV